MKLTNLLTDELVNKINFTVLAYHYASAKLVDNTANQIPSLASEIDKYIHIQCLYANDVRWTTLLGGIPVKIAYNNYEDNIFSRTCKIARQIESFLEIELKKQELLNRITSSIHNLSLIDYSNPVRPKPEVKIVWNYENNISIYLNTQSIKQSSGTYSSSIGASTLPDGSDTWVNIFFDCSKLRLDEVRPHLANALYLVNEYNQAKDLLEYLNLYQDKAQTNPEQIEEQ